MASNSLWYGYLEAGEKSSPVVIDHQLNDDNSSAVYIFNLKRNQILQYRRDIVEPKLRELADDDNAPRKELKSAFDKARKEFSGKVQAKPAEQAATPAKSAPVMDIPDDDYDMPDIEDDDFDGDMDED